MEMVPSPFGGWMKLSDSLISFSEQPSQCLQ